jgi:NTP pyrophosphatase (non-canonical NTP hydrolase)
MGYPHYSSDCHEYQPYQQLQARLAALELGPPQNTHALYSAVSKTRAMRWHRGGLDEWSVTDWSNALAGEVGELCNAIKKYRRIEDRLQQHDGDTPAPKSYEDALKQIKKEIGDSYAYLDLLAQRFGLDLWECARDTFNAISEREGFPDRISKEIA